jgi:hypothetical protein
MLHVDLIGVVEAASTESKIIIDVEAASTECRSGDPGDDVCLETMQQSHRDRILIYLPSNVF